MNMKETITYYGWSSFVIDASQGALAFDPLYRELFGGSWSTIDDYRNVRVICVTHGHYDHYIDVPVILRQNEAVVVSSAQVCAHLKKKYHIPEERLRPIKPQETIKAAGYSITAFDWGHREMSREDVFREGLLRAEIFPTIQFAWLNFIGSPFTAPYFGYCVETPLGTKVLNYCEGFNDLMKIETITDLRELFSPEVLLAGIQLNFEREVSLGVQAFAPKKAILFTPINPCSENSASFPLLPRPL